MPNDLESASRKLRSQSVPSNGGIAQFVVEAKNAFDRVKRVPGEGSLLKQKIESLLRWRAYLRADAIERGMEYETLDPSLAGDLLSFGRESSLDELPESARKSALTLMDTMNDVVKSPADPEMALRLRWATSRLIWDLMPIPKPPQVVIALVGRRVSDRLRSVTFRHPELGVTEAFFEIERLPEGATEEGARFEMTVTNDNRGELVMSIPDDVKTEGPRKAEQKQEPTLPLPPEDWNNVEQVTAYRAALDRLIPD